jgi:hypothetical protein
VLKHGGHPERACRGQRGHRGEYRPGHAIHELPPIWPPAADHPSQARTVAAGMRGLW